MHCGIKTNVNPESDFYDKTDPEKNNHVTSFTVREMQMGNLRKMGVKKLFYILMAGRIRVMIISTRITGTPVRKPEAGKA